VREETTVLDDKALTRGCSHPIGATLAAGGANFSVFFRSAGDEVQRSQSGNNNGYSTDKASSFDWSLLVNMPTFYGLRNCSLSAWRGVKLHRPDWSPFSNSIAISEELKNGGLLLHAVMNSYWESLDFGTSETGERSELAAVVDTALAPSK
jgi:glycogen operon protein